MTALPLAPKPSITPIVTRIVPRIGITEPLVTAFRSAITAAAIMNPTPANRATSACVTPTMRDASKVTSGAKHKVTPNARPTTLVGVLVLTRDCIFIGTPNGEVEGPPRSAQSSAVGAHWLPRPRRGHTGRSRTPPTIVRGRVHRSYCARAEAYAQTGGKVLNTAAEATHAVVADKSSDDLAHCPRAPLQLQSKGRRPSSWVLPAASHS